MEAEKLKKKQQVTEINFDKKTALKKPSKSHLFNN
jgi:hypothetical protein